MTRRPSFPPAPGEGDRFKRRRSEPFHEVIQEIMDWRGIGNNELARATKDHDPQRGWTQTYMSQLRQGPRHARGLFRPTSESMELLGEVLGIDPHVWREYREDQAAREARRLSTEVGLDEVLAKLRELEADR